MVQLCFSNWDLNEGDYIFIFSFFFDFLRDISFLDNSLRSENHFKMISEHVINLEVLNCEIDLSVDLFFISISSLS